MARKRNMELDLTPVATDQIEVYPINTAEQTTTSITAEEVSAVSAVDDVSLPVEYEVEIEFTPDKLGLRMSAFTVSYLGSFRHAKVTDERMANRIQRDLCEALELDDVFVEVHRKTPPDKRVRVGKV